MNFSTWQGMRTRDPRRLALGTVQWGMPYGIANQIGQPAQSDVEAMLEIAHDAGIRVLDTARTYGESEALLGTTLSREDGWKVVTKLDPDVQTGELGIAEVLERVAISLTSSRHALRLDVLPNVLLHRFTHRHACGGKLWRMLLAERDAGRIGALGISAATPEEAWAALEDADIEILQVATSLLDRRLYKQGFFARARELGRSVYVRSVYLQGIAHLDPLALPQALAGLAPALSAIATTARELGVPPRALFLAFVREIPGAMPVLGFESPVQLSEALSDWQSDAIEGVRLAALVETLPEIPESLLDPSRWPALESASTDGASANQPGLASIATMPG